MKTIQFRFVFQFFSVIIFILSLLTSFVFHWMMILDQRMYEILKQFCTKVSAVVGWGANRNRKIVKNPSLVCCFSTFFPNCFCYFEIVCHCFSYINIQCLLNSGIYPFPPILTFHTWLFYIIFTFDLMVTNNSAFVHASPVYFISRYILNNS